MHGADAEQRLMFHPTHNRSILGTTFTGYTQPNQQCQSVEGQNGLLRYEASISWKLAV